MGDVTVHAVPSKSRAASTSPQFSTGRRDANGASGSEHAPNDHKEQKRSIRRDVLIASTAALGGFVLAGVGACAFGHVKRTRENREFRAQQQQLHGKTN